MRQLILYLVFAVFITGCSRNVDLEREKALLLEIDRAFSRLSVEKGTAEAFDRFMDDDAVLFRDGAYPFEGRSAIRELLSKGGGTLRWEPYFADVSRSGELGYTLGRYTNTYMDELGAENTSYGYYVSVWKRGRDGNWRFVFDSGIESPPPID